MKFQDFADLSFTRTNPGFIKKALLDKMGVFGHICVVPQKTIKSDLKHERAGGSADKCSKTPTDWHKNARNTQACGTLEVGHIYFFNNNLFNN